MQHELVGRESELAALSAFVDGTADGARAMLLWGEAGIGKTVLWRAALARARARGDITVLAAEPARSETQLSFSTLGDLLDPVLETALPELPDPQRKSLEVALLLREDTGSDVGHRTVFAAVLGTLRAAAHTPVLVAIDDVQWTDRPSARALEFALRRLEGVPILVLLAERASESDGPVPLGLDRAHGERCERLRVGPLSLGAIHHLLRERLGASLPRPTLVRLHRTSAGNPFFALEMARALLLRDEPPRAGDALPLPANLNDLVAERLRRLPASTRSVLLLAALASHPTVGMLQEAFGNPDQALDDLSRAADAGVIDVTGDRISFAHPLLASSLLEGARLADVRRAHGSLAETSTDPESRARHLALATDGPDEGVAAALEEAARHARARGATDAAAELGELAIRRTAADDLRGLTRRRIVAADTLVEAGDMERAKRLLEEVHRDTPAGAERAAALWRLAELSEEGDLGIGLLTQALEEAGGDHGVLSATHTVLSRGLWILGDPANALSHARTAWSEGAATGDPDREARALTALVFSFTMQGRALDPRARERARALDDLVDRCPAYDAPGFWVGFQHMCRSELGAARFLMDGALRRAERLGDEYSRAGIYLQLTELECRAGRFDRAVAYADECRLLAQQTGGEQSQAGSLYAVALAAAHVGAVETARTAGVEGLAIDIAIGDRIFEAQNRRVLGFLELSLGHAAEAERFLAPLPALIRDAGVVEPGVYQFAPNLIEVLLALGELERAGELLTELEATAEALDHPWARAVGPRCRALLCAAEGDQAGAEAAIELGLAAHEAIPEPFELGRMHLVAGAIRRRYKQKRAARESLDRALATFEDLRTPLWADRARAELRRIGLRSPEPGGLTPTEQRIAELVVAGRTNQEIADALFVSIRTVEANLTRTYRKLDVRSRTELVSRLRDTGA